MKTPPSWWVPAFVGLLMQFCRIWGISLYIVLEIYAPWTSIVQINRKFKLDICSSGEGGTNIQVVEILKD